MINHGRIKSSFQPPEIEFTEKSVFVASNISNYTQTLDDHIIHGFEYDYKEYDKNEYIMLMVNEISELQDELQATKILLGVD